MASGTCLRCYDNTKPLNLDCQYGTVVSFTSTGTSAQSLRAFFDLSPRLFLYNASFLSQEQNVSPSFNIEL